MAAKVTPDRIEEKLVRHSFTQPERLELGSELARSLGRQRSIETEFEGVKAAFKAKIAEAESQVETLSIDIGNGFTMRRKKCRVVFRPKDRKKDYFPEIKDGVFETQPVLTEDMDADDFQAELFAAEQQFERRTEVVLFRDAVLVLGRLADKWYAALRVKVGQQAITERLDPAAKRFKTRPQAVEATLARLSTWLLETFGEETSKGFSDAIAKVSKIQLDLAE